MLTDACMPVFNTLIVAHIVRDKVIWYKHGSINREGVEVTETTVLTEYINMLASNIN